MKGGGGLEEERGMEGSWPVLQISLEPFKFFTKSESAVAKGQYQKKALLSDKISVWLNTNSLPFPSSLGSLASGGLKWGDMRYFPQVKGWPAYEMCPRVADEGQCVFVLWCFAIRSVSVPSSPSGSAAYIFLSGDDSLQQ